MECLNFFNPRRDLEDLRKKLKSLEAEQEAVEQETSRRRGARDSLVGRREKLGLRRADLVAEAAVAGPEGGVARAGRDSLAEELGTLGGSLATAAAAVEESDLQLSLWTTERDGTCAKAGRRQQFGTREARDA